MTAATMQAEALGRARSGESTANYGAIFRGLMAKGIPESEIEPRVNVLTYHAWRALGRQVRAGEHGVSIISWRDIPAKIDENTGEILKKGGKIPTGGSVFHISQADPETKKRPTA